MEQTTLRRMSLDFRKRHKHSRQLQEIDERESDRMHLWLSILTFVVAGVIALLATM
ncbi:MAG: hypothetical protein U1F36_16165 [Planctomycetota bacterium]